MNPITSADLDYTGLDVMRDPAIAGSFVEAVTKGLSCPGPKRPFSAILAAAVEAVKDTQGIGGLIEQ